MIGDLSFVLNAGKKPESGLTGSAARMAARPSWQNSIALDL